MVLQLRVDMHERDESTAWDAHRQLAATADRALELTLHRETEAYPTRGVQGREFLSKNTPLFDVQSFKS